MALVKSGWLLRQSTILRRWKKNWFDLWSHGHLLFYDDQNRHDLEDRIHMKVDCINVRVGDECRGLQPPEGKPQDCLLQIICRDGKVLSLCAESADDCLAWKFALQDARTNEAYIGSEVMYEDNSISSAPPPYTAYATPSPEIYGYPPYNGAYPPPGPQIIYTSNGQTYAIPYQYPNQGPYGHAPANHVIIRERYRDNDGDLALGMLAGAATGMALGSLFWVF
ncbi:pleckstrin homology domain-containing family B member 2 [Anolis carolinensis]|nr:PREDICTED: pleckstrin homology domain-containing family B member 2 [Anolis carolinensis]XP_008104690.1 PREDICTED: pleckstrin homology domain-containing family B member 2 [Anolis carolinensis]XP_016847634.1 PREDICTED: pleckstrin homology domain-containing family B member 2 [Anolis carolinensis]|eukprot:XP_003218444.1 PREDICTED: pleckstrin homology domain-containing family B member 2 [Anolis carolinensis]